MFTQPGTPGTALQIMPLSPQPKSHNEGILRLHDLEDVCGSFLPPLLSSVPGTMSADVCVQPSWQDRPLGLGAAPRGHGACKSQSAWPLS